MARLVAALSLVALAAGSDYGPMLFDRSGQARYLFDKETGSRPECYGACAVAWPPVLTTVGTTGARGGCSAPPSGGTVRYR